MRRLDRYFADIRGQQTPTGEDIAGWEHLLWNTELLVDSHDRRACSIAGVLLFGRNPNRWLPHAGIDAAAYAGKEKEYASIERSQLRGPYVALRDRQNEVVESGVVEQAIAFVRRTAPPTADVDMGVRVDRPAIPDVVIREAAVNALVHRDYLITTADIELSVFADRIEVISPGRLPNGVTPDRMRTGVRAARNQLLKDVRNDAPKPTSVRYSAPSTRTRSHRWSNGMPSRPMTTRASNSATSNPSVASNAANAPLSS
jgi:ATP-dependent DNA helicase RecG